MLLLTTLAVIGLLIAATAFYVAAEFAAVSIRKSKIRQLAEEGHRTAKRLLPLVEDPEQLDRYIACSQIGITLASLVLGAYGEATLAPMLTPLLRDAAGLDPRTALSTAAVLILIVLSIFTMILGELVPKSLAIQFPYQAAFFTAYPMGWSLRLFRPFIGILNGSGLLILRLFGVNHTHRHVHSPEEIKLLIAESTEGGILAPDDRRRLSRALELGASLARDVMIPSNRIVAIDADASVEELFDMAAESPYTRLAVRNGSLQQIIGVVHTKDVTLRLMASRPPKSVREVMRPIPAIAENMRADRLLMMLRERHVQMALVTAAGGEVIGLVSLEDVLAQVFGRLPDEFKSGAARVPK